MQYQVQTESFEGPLELLLDLIEKNKLSINEVTLAHISDQYVAFVKKLEEYRPQEVASFLVIAATLMLAKSRSLLPNLPLTKEEEEDIEELENRLQAYRRMREFTERVQVLQRRKKHMYARVVSTDLPVLFYPPKSLTLQDMTHLMRRMIETLPKKELLPEKTIQTIVSLEERMVDLERRMEKNIRTSFSSLVSENTEKIDIIISFLALLELIKQGIMLAEQQNRFGDISLHKS